MLGSHELGNEERARAFLVKRYTVRDVRLDAFWYLKTPSMEAGAGHARNSLAGSLPLT
ncbi:hypothetical protein EDC26_105143 [Paralcaligenes ureilyticus]|uniref:Uncharacterized protein n=1 Tax=Paralcaligenes ureilyticus TaxID=627131 RepID=A0A4R3M5G0_9BURK|nr:hypothetical protein EDC26_105143 [Paralcaligenes ureilyticus]